jgi:pilus assembly protein FimV
MAETTADPHQVALAASATAAVGAASAAEPTAAPATVAAAAPATDPAHGTPVHGTPADSTPAPAEPAQPPAPHADAQPATTASLPAAERTAAGPLGRIRPSLSDEERQLARQQSARLRGDVVAPATAQAVAPPAIVYAVVTRPNRQREVAASGLAVMRSAGARLSPPVPEHRELMQQQGEWRAAWWPFANQVDAERARVMLASRGLKAEVVEF